MFASAPSPSLSSTVNPASQPSRPSRLRGLNVIRNYTQNHLSLHNSQPSTPTGAGPSSNALSRVLSSPPLATAPVTGSGHGATQQDLFSTFFPSRRTRSSERVVPDGDHDDMARRRGIGSHTLSASGRRAADGPNSLPTQATNNTDSGTLDAQGLSGLPPDQMPTIRFIPYQDPRSSKPSLAFPATSRTLPHEDCVIRVGRYSERDLSSNVAPGQPSAAPVGFKSKVVSRRHCEFWCSRGQWYVKDVKSSSGTFLNHIRLSQPSAESRPFPVNDGDVIQLGIDFRGGEEQIFRCVKIRVECNRAWQQGLNSFNKTTHKRLKALGTPRTEADNSSNYTSECSICLMSIAPCQSLFVAPCSHVWHFRCIRPILMDLKNYPQFLCPNCRAVADLEADVDEVPANWEEEDNSSGSDGGHRDETRVSDSNHQSNAEEDMDRAIAASLQTNLRLDNDGNATTRSGTVPQLEMDLGPSITQLTSPTHEGAQPPAEQNEGPLTPRNEAGPFIFDGTGGGIPGMARQAEPSAAS